MKMREAHVVPLSSHAVAILRELHPLTGRGRYLFPGIRTATEPMSENTVHAALRRMGFDKDTMRSEERRVGQAVVGTCRYRWSPDSQTKKPIQSTQVTY